VNIAKNKPDFITPNLIAVVIAACLMLMMLTLAFVVRTLSLRERVAEGG